MHYALQHLEKVLETVSEKLRTMTESELRAAAASYNPVHLNDETDVSIWTCLTQIGNRGYIVTGILPSKRETIG